MYYPNGTAGVSINGLDLSLFSAKLSSKYTVSGAEASPTVFHGQNRALVEKLAATYGMKSLKLPLDFDADSKNATMTAIAAFNAILSGVRVATGIEPLTVINYDDSEPVEIDLGDGYSYLAVCTSYGQIEWINDHIATIDYEFSAIQRGELVSTTTRLFTVEGSYPRIDCTVTATVPAETVATWATSADMYLLLRLRQRIIKQLDDGTLDTKNYYADSFFYQAAVLIPQGTTGDIVVAFDGLNKQMTVNGEAAEYSRINYSDYPFLIPGPIAMTVYAGDGTDWDTWDSSKSSTHWKSITAGTYSCEYYPAYV